jgi:hypothetical protein
MSTSAHKYLLRHMNFNALARTHTHFETSWVMLVNLALGGNQHEFSVAFCLYARVYLSTHDRTASDKSQNVSEIEREKRRQRRRGKLKYF